MVVHSLYKIYAEIKCNKIQIKYVYDDFSLPIELAWKNLEQITDIKIASFKECYKLNKQRI